MQGSSGLAEDNDALGLMPLPKTVQRGEGEYELRADIKICTDAAARDSGDYLADRMRTVAGCRVTVEPLPAQATLGADIILKTGLAGTNAVSEGYQLMVDQKTGVVIQGADAAGVFYGVQTLLQLLPPQINSSTRMDGVAWKIPAVTIADAPQYKWRGYMLDVSRHFFNVAEIKQTLDFMASQKLNVFHWHLVDDHGWRIEIKKYPKLTEVGAWRKGIGFELASNESTAYGVDGRYGGFYTQDQIREVVAYAQARHITVVPEIELPGHSTAALVAYPELSCTGGPFSMDMDLGIYNGIFCAGNEESYTFLENVLGEIFQLFPSPYIHIGGDEVPKTNWQNCAKCQARIKAEGLKDEQELQSYFVKRIGKFVTDHGRKLIGWSEIMQGGLAPDATLMDWNGGGAEAANSGHDVVMASQEYTYFCYYQSLDRPPKLKAARRYLPLDKTYAFDPLSPKLKPEAVPHILGVEACVWTPFFASLHEVEEMSFPRLCAFSEIGWSPRSSLDYSSFTQRLKIQEKRFDAAGIAYWNDHAVKIGEWKPAAVNRLHWDVPSTLVAPGKYRLSLNYAAGKHPLDIASAVLLEDGREVARDTHEGLAGSGYNRTVKAQDWNYFLDLPRVKPGATYSVEVSVTGMTDSSGAVFLEPSARDYAEK
jgi:hexosaminidase